MTDHRSKSEIQRDNRDEAIRLRQREGEVTSSGPVLSDEEIGNLWATHGYGKFINGATPDECRDARLEFSRRLLATFAERVAERIEQSPLRTAPAITDHGAGINFGIREAARIVREAAK